ncbi:family 43 glycosylhydrolase [Streptomyces sp. NPDC059957]|uniref:family 43 glycosylhydrolase n=1 Tax=Streptomyces sp. NPDC059957 TaxID=3347016 RepID=UPI00364B2477
MDRHTHSPRTGRRTQLAVRAVLAICAALAACLAALPARAAAGGPVLDRDFADPDVIQVAGTYHAYATNGNGRNIQHATSRDLTTWSPAAADALPVLGGWAATEPRGKVWAPDVFDNGNGFTMHYTARDAASGTQCIGVALSRSPDGPFTPVGERPLICPAEEGGAIDAAGFTEGGRRYVVWKNDGNCCSRDTWLHLQETSWDGTRLTGEAVRLITRDRDWEGDLVEAPTLVRRGDRYVLFYSANAYDGERYKTGYAVADRLTGPYTKAADPLMTTDSFSGAIVGPGGQDIVAGPDGRDRIVFHGWSGPSRVLHAADLGFAHGRPVVRGSKARHQAENARVHRAIVRAAPSAQGDRAVGHIDHPDSFVEFDVFAASGGHHTLTLHFGNGSLDHTGAPTASSHLLSVNGSAAGAVHYPHSGWDTWRTARAPLTLREGWNTVRLGKGEWYAELDSVDVA